MKISINTDAISQDFETAVLLGIEWGVYYFELKRLYGKRIPDITNDEVGLVQKVLHENQVKLSSLALPTLSPPKSIAEALPSWVLPPSPPVSVDDSTYTLFEVK